MTGNFVFSTMQGIARLVTTCCFDLKVYGVHNVPKNGGVLIVGNHQSFIDPAAIGAQIPRMTNYLGKSELFNSPLKNWVNRRMGGFPVRQGEGDIGAVREAIRRLQEGNALVLFPEGGRTWDGELQPIKPGVGLIVRKAGVPVLPAIIEGSHDAWKRGTKFWKQHPVRLRFGQPQMLGHLKTHEIVQTVDQMFHATLQELRADIALEDRAGRRTVLSRRHSGEGLIQE